MRHLGTTVLQYCQCEHTYALKIIELSAGFGTQLLSLWSIKEHKLNTKQEKSKKHKKICLKHNQQEYQEKLKKTKKQKETNP